LGEVEKRLIVRIPAHLLASPRHLHYLAVRKILSQQFAAVI
jgi:hypothetical protein